MKDFQKLFKPISESGESEELETAVESSKPTAAAAFETVDRSLKSTDVTDTGVQHGPDDAEDGSDEERDFVDDASGPDRITLLSFDNIAYEDPVLDSDLQVADQSRQQMYLGIPEEEDSSSKRHGRHRISISSDSDSEKLIDAEMVDIQSTLQTQFESTAASKLAESLGSDQSERTQHAARGDEKESKHGIVMAEPHESIRRTHDVEVLSAIESQLSNNFTIGAKQPDLFDFSHDAETENVADTLMLSAPADDVMKMSTSSDASAEATILAATYDLDLGAVSRVVATYDMTPDSVDKVFVIDKQSKIIQSSPDDEVFETEGGVKGAPKTEDSSVAADEFDTNEMLFGLVRADDVDRYEAYLEVMQQHRAVADQELGALLDLGVCEPGAAGESSCSMQPDLIQGMPRNVDVDILSGGSIYGTSEVQDHSAADSELITIYDDEPCNEENASAEVIQVSQCLDNEGECSSSWDAFSQLQCEDTACENAPHMPASFGKGALDSDNMYQVFQQNTSNSPGGDDVLVSGEDAFSGLQYDKQADDATDKYPHPFKRKLEVDQDDDFDSDFLAESAEPELMALSVEKDDDECSTQVGTLDYGDDCQAAPAGSRDSWRVLDSRCLDRPLSPLPDNEYRILDDTDDAYVATRVLRSSTVDSDAGMDVAFKQVAEDDDLNRRQAAAIVTHVMASAKAAAENVDDEDNRNSYLPDADIDEGFFQVEGIQDLAPKDLQSGTFNEEVDDVDEGVLPEDDDIGCSGEICEQVQNHSPGGSVETVSESPNAGNLHGNYVHQKASEFVDYLVREAQVEAENIATRPQEAGDELLTDFTKTGLCRLDESPEEYDAERSTLDHDDVSKNTLSSEDTVMLSDEQIETSRSEAGFNDTILEWSAMQQTSLEDYGDSSSVDSFATVVPCHQETAEDRMEDLASVSSSFHSDLHSSYLEDQPEPMVCLDARDDELGLMHEGETVDSPGSEHFEAMKDDLNSSMVEMVPCYESPDDDKYGIYDDDFDHPMMMTLATIKEEDERSSTSGKSGKTGSSSERVDGTSDSDKQASSVDLHAEYPCRRLVGKSSDKDDVSVSSSLLEFETLEKEMQDRTSLDSLAKLGSQQSVAEKSSEASSSLLEFERIEKEMQDRTSHDSLTKLGSLQSVAERGSEKDNVSVSSSLAEFERLESEIDVAEPTGNISVHVTYGMVGSTTSLNAFLMDDSDSQAESVTRVSQTSRESLAFDEQFESEARAVVSMLEAGALPIMQDRMSVNAEVESGGADAEVTAAERDEAEQNVDAELPVYPEYQDIVQIIRKASETAHEDVYDSSRSHGTREPDMDSLNERDDAAMSDKVVTAEARDQWDCRGMDNDSLQDDGELQMYTGLQDSDQVVPSCEGMFPTERADEDVMETSADSIEGVREEAALERSADSLELRSSLALHAEVLMQHSFDSLSAEDAPCQPHDSFDADSLHETSTPASSRQPAGLLMASVESGAWSQSDSLLSTTETLKSSGSSHDDSARMSPESPNALFTTTRTKYDDHVTTTVTASASRDASRDDEAQLQGTQFDSCYYHSDVSPSSTGVDFPSQNGSRAERMSGN